MRAVKDSLPAPYGEVEESEGPRSTVAPRPTWVPFQGREENKLGRMEKERPGALLARRAPTMKRWSLDARSEGQFACSLWGR